MGGWLCITIPSFMAIFSQRFPRAIDAQAVHMRTLEQGRLVLMSCSHCVALLRQESEIKDPFMYIMFDMMHRRGSCL